MGLANYSELQAEIADHLDRDDLTGNIPTFIRLAEARHQRDVRSRDMIARAQLSVSARHVALPSRFLEMLTLRLLTDPVTVLQETNLHEMNRIRDEGTGKPEWFVVHENIEFDKTPDDSYTAEMVYYQSLQALSGSNTTNALLDRAPDVYLYGALLAAEPFLAADERIQVWAQLYRAAVDSLNKTDRGRGGPLVSRVVGRGP